MGVPMSEIRDFIGESMVTPEEVEKVLGLKYTKTQISNLKTIDFNPVTLVDYTIGPKSEDAFLLFPGFNVTPAGLVELFPQVFNEEQTKNIDKNEMSKPIKLRWFFICTQPISASTPWVNDFNNLPGFGEVLLMTLLYRQLFEIDLWDKQIVLCQACSPRSVQTKEGLAANYATIGPFGQTLQILGREDDLLFADKESVLGFAVGRRPKT